MTYSLRTLVWPIVFNASVLTALTVSLEAAPLIKRNMTQGERVEKLYPFFSPRFDQMLEIDKTSLSAANLQKKPRKLKGYIKVLPPKNTCFTITKRESIPDLYICKAKVLSYRIEDLTMNGRLNWTVSTGGGDIGTHVEWISKIRPGKVVDLNMPWPGPAKPVFIEKCIAQHTPSKGRVMYIYLVTGERWVIRLPKLDKKVSQPPVVPNLYVAEMPDKKGIPTSKKKGTAKLDAQLVYPNNKNHVKLARDRKWVPTWQTSPRHSFVMGADGFVPHGSSTPGLKGLCRYKYSGYRTDFASGSFECHDAQSYRWVYIPAPCLGDLKPRS